MSNKITVKELVFYSVAALIFSVLAISNSLLLIPGFFVVSAIISYAVYSCGMWNGIYLSLALLIFNTSYGVTAADGTIVISFLFCTLSIITGFICATGFKKFFNFNKMVFLISAYFTAIFLVSTAVAKYFFDLNINNIIRKVFVELYNNVIAVIKLYNLEESLMLNTGEFEYFNVFYTFMPGLVPCCVILLSMISAIIIYAVSKVMNRKALIENSYFENGSDKFRVNIYTNIFMAISFVIYLTSGVDFYEMIGINMIIIIGSFYVFNTLSLINHKLKMQSPSYVRRAVILFAITVLSVIIMSLNPVINILYLAIFIGFADSIFDFRKLKDKDED